MTGHKGPRNDIRSFRGLPGNLWRRSRLLSEQNVAACAQGAVATVCIPQRGGHKAPERQAYERSLASKRAGHQHCAGTGLPRQRNEKACRFFAGFFSHASGVLPAFTSDRGRDRRRTEASRRRQACRMHLRSAADCVPTWWRTLRYGLSAMPPEAQRSETSFVEIAKCRSMVFTGFTSAPLY
jgi:hypothetical protein